MQNESDYEKAIRLEAEFYDRKLHPWRRDYRTRHRRKNPTRIWHDPDLDDITRGVYRKQLIYPSVSRPLRIMDLGCGLGWLSLELARQGHRVDAFDIASKRIEFAKAYYQEVKAKEKGVGEIDYFVDDLNKIEIQKDTYDLVLCWDNLHHAVEIERLMKQVHCGLKTGGRFLVTDNIGVQSRIVLMIDLAVLCAIEVLFHQQSIVRAVSQRLGRWFTRKPPSVDPHDGMAKSPFEGITGREMIDYFIEEFGSGQVNYETAVAFAGRWLPRIPGPRKLRMAITSFVMKIDHYFIRKGLVEGRFVFMQATKT